MKRAKRSMKHRLKQMMKRVIRASELEAFMYGDYPVRDKMLGKLTRGKYVAYGYWM